MKNIKVYVLAIVLVLGLSACTLTGGQSVQKSAEGGAVNQSEPFVVEDATKKIMFNDLANHASKDSCWIVIDGNVYDMTKFAPSHPGGEEKIYAQCGKDGTEVFKGMPKHSLDKLPPFLIGELEK